MQNFLVDSRKRDQKTQKCEHSKVNIPVRVQKNHQFNIFCVKAWRTPLKNVLLPEIQVSLRS